MASAAAAGARGDEAWHEVLPDDDSTDPDMIQGAIRIDTAIDVERPAREVFDYVTTPALWHTWHPATAEVRDAPDRSLEVGETALEVIRMAGRTDEATWTVRAREAPRLWQIETETHKGAAHIVYRIEPRGGGCRFQRSLEFRSKGAPWRWLDSTLTRFILVRQSRRALQNLKRVMEANRGLTPGSDPRV